MWHHLGERHGQTPLAMLIWTNNKYAVSGDSAVATWMPGQCTSLVMMPLYHVCPGDNLLFGAFTPGQNFVTLVQTSGRLYLLSS